MKLLVVENEPLVAQALKLLLASVACEVEVVCVGEGCDRPSLLRLARADRYDLLVLDAGAENTALGPELWEHSQAQEHPPTPILLLTDSALATPPWATETLIKPVAAVDLITRVSALLGTPTAAISPVVERARSEARFRNMADYAPVMVWVTDATGCCTYLSQSWYEFTGQCEATGLGLGWLEAVHPDDRATAKAIFLNATERQQDFRLEYRLRRRDGEYYWMIDAARPWLGVEGEFEGYIGSVMDISERVRSEAERKQASLALRESEEKYRLLFNSMDEGFCVIEMLFDEGDRPIDYRFLDVNPTFAQQTGLADAQGKRIREMVPNLETHWFEVLGKVALTGEPVRFEDHARDMHRWFDVFGFRFGAPELRQVAVLFRNVTERRLAEAALKESERKIREQAALLDIASDAITVRDLDHRLLYWNQGAERLYGFTAAEALGKTAYDLLRSETAQHSEMMPPLLTQGEWRGELDKFTKTDQAVTVAARWTLVNDEMGQPKFILSVETDITEKKALEAQFYQAQRVESLGRLASGIAHDLNNVFTPIVTIAQLLRLTQRHLSDKAQDHLRLLEESAKRGASMVQQILSITRSSSGTRTEVNLGPLLQDLGNILQQSLPKHIDLRLPERAVGRGQELRVSADPTHLHQVLMNLCVNARDAMPTSGTLTIAAELVAVDAALAQTHIDAEVGQYVRLTVADTGTGIDPGLRDRIFDPFFTTKAPGQGTGLGLATVLGIVKASDGFVRVVSEVGQGTQMQVYLPALTQPSASDAPEVDWPDAPPQGQGELLLVVEDDASVQHSVRSLLLSYNYRILVANNGLEALDCYFHQPAHLVVVDMMMPGMDGIALIQRLKAMRPSVKIVATSGLPTYQAAAIAAGASAFLLKPYDLSDLLETIASQLR